VGRRRLRALLPQQRDHLHGLDLPGDGFRRLGRLRARALPVSRLRPVQLRSGRIGIALNVTPVEPASGDPADVAAAHRLDGFHNRWFLDGFFHRRYPPDMVEDFERRHGFPAEATDAELGALTDHGDFLGVNFYTRLRARANPASGFFGLDELAPAGEVTAMGWEVAPDALHQVLLRIARDYTRLPLLITENGAAFDDVRNGEPVVPDPQRVDYLRRHVAALTRALADGVDVRGYFPWSLLDNFEWEQGYSKRFGLVYVDYATQERIPKQSALWYRDFIAGARNGDGDRGRTAGRVILATLLAATIAANPFAGVRWYVDPHSPAREQARSRRASRPGDARLLERIGSRPQADWFTESEPYGAADQRVDTITRAGALPVLVAYFLPDRDCGNYSADAGRVPPLDRRARARSGAGRRPSSSSRTESPDSTASRQRAAAFAPSSSATRSGAYPAARRLGVRRRRPSGLASRPGDRGAPAGGRGRGCARLRPQRVELPHHARAARLR
jgi:hypothetical protein